MKKVFTILVSILLVSLIIFGVYSFLNKDKSPESSDISPEVQQDITERQPVLDDPSTEEDEAENNPKVDSSQVFTEIGIFSGRIDTYSIELVVGSDMPMTFSFRLSPEVAEEFSSYNFEPGSFISFEYTENNGQRTITKIIQ